MSVVCCVMMTQVAYSTLPNDYRFSVTCKRGTGASRFMAELERALDDMGALYEHAPKGRTEEPSGTKFPQLGSAAAAAVAAARAMKSKL